jgi:predicted sulfurtransferase
MTAPSFRNLIVIMTTLLFSLRTNVAFQAARLTTRPPMVRSSLLLLERLSNQELAERRTSVYRAKRQAREKTIQQRVDKHLRVKRLLQTTNNGNFEPPTLYAIKVWVDDALRQELRLSGREKRGRVFLEKESDNNNEATTTLKGLRSELHGFFTALRKESFLLTASLPAVAPDGTVLSEHPKDSWKIESDEDVVKTFSKADDYFESTSTDLKRASIQINVWKDPNARPPPPPPEYLNDMVDPNETDSMTMISFYAFPPSGIEDPEAFAFDLKKKWKPFNALGRVYVAEEGVNAQMSIPTNVLNNFMDCCRSVPELGKHMENDINIDPLPLSLEEFAVAGVPVNGKPAPPFRNLHVRVRTQIVADGLDKSLDWQSAGYDMPPMEWHEQLKQAREKRGQGANEGVPILLDCRNDYETDVGIFDGAEPLGTESFRESWDVLKNRLAETPKDAPIMTYCTGGMDILCRGGDYSFDDLMFRFCLSLHRNSLRQSWGIFDTRIRIHQCVSFSRRYHCLRSYSQRKGRRGRIHVQGYQLCVRRSFGTRDYRRCLE